MVDVMKKLALFIFAVMFLANTVVVSAWAKPCLMNSPAEMSQDMDTSMSSDMPCHDNQNEQKTKHCDGICLCAHASISQTPIINQSESLNAPVSSSDYLTGNNETVNSRATAPPRRPPKFNS